MREIKFKLWHVNKKFFSKAKDVGELNPYEEMDTVLYIQYIGLKDKNGVEIYEGDLVSLGGQYSVEVLFLDGGYCFIADEVIYPASQLVNGSVGGSVFENKELLNEQT